MPSTFRSRGDHANPARYRHRFTALTDWLVSPYNLGFCIYNWGFNVLGGRKHEAFRRRVIELAELRGDEDILDAGCGTGLTTLRIAEQHPGCRVYGIDLSPKMIEVARNDAAERGLDVDLRTGSITDLPYPDAAFDVVLTNIMFHHLDLAEKRLAVAEIARVLKAGGRYVSAEFGPRARNRWSAAWPRANTRSIPPIWPRPGWPFDARN